MILSACLVVWISSSALVGCATPVNAAKLDELKAQASTKLDDLKKAATDAVNKLKG